MIIQSTSQHKQLIQLLNLKRIMLQVKTTQQSSTNDAEQPENIPADRVVNDQTDDDNFDDSSREYNDGQGSKSASNWSKPV